MQRPGSPIREAHLHDEYFPTVKDFGIIDEVGLLDLKVELVTVWLLWIDNIGASSLCNAFANFIGLNSRLDRIVVQGGFRYGLNFEDRPYIERWRPPRISVLNTKFKRCVQLGWFFKSGALRGNPSSN